MKKELKYALYAGVLVILGMLAGFNLKNSVERDQQIEVKVGTEKFQKALWFIERNYVKDVEGDKLVDEAIVGMLESLDPHSFYIPAKEMKEMEEQMEGSFEGIGIEFNLLNDTLYVVTPISGGPSEAVGLRSGDRIIKIDGENVGGIGLTNNDVRKKLKGPKGTSVHVTILRKKVGRELTFEIIRDKIPIYSVDVSYMLNKQTGYIKISRFAGTTHEEFVTHLSKLKKEGLKDLVLDLRGNPGGYMDQAQLIGDEFLGKNKTVVYTEGRTPQSKATYVASSQISGFEKGGLVILLDYGSASASEIVSGCVQDWDRGLIVGVRSFGKGLVQTQRELGDGSALRIVISKYYTPSGRCIQKPYDLSDEEYHEEINKRFESGEIYDPSKVDFPDSLKFKTNSGRTVYGGGGIMPDFFVPRDTTYDSEYLALLIGFSVFREYTFKFRDSKTDFLTINPDLETFETTFSVDAEVMADFIEFAKEKEVEMDEEDYARSEPIIKNYIKAFIARSYYGDEGFFKTINQFDNQIKHALKVLPEAKEISRTGKFSSPKKK